MHRAVALTLLVAACSDPAETNTTPDAGPPDAPGPDAGRATRLSQAGLYRNFATKEIAPDLMPFAPTYTLWADGLVKRRWLRLPPGTSIDKSNPDHWQFPVGTQLWKEFATPGGVVLETRLIERTGPGKDDYWMGAFVWSDDGSDATYMEDGAVDIRGTDHDAPSTIRCGTCHNGEPGRILGYSAVQLGATAPGPPAVAAALGYLHANCGHCHNENGAARPDTDMILRLELSATTPEQSAAYQTAIGKPTQYFRDPDRPLRIAAGNPDASAVLFRMMQRGDSRQMPPIATEHSDPEGVALIRAWIQDLP